MSIQAVVIRTKRPVLVKSYSKLRDLDFCFRMKIDSIDDCARSGVCNMHELHFKIGRRVGKVISYISLSGSYISILVQHTIFWQTQSRIFQKLKVYKQNYFFSVLLILTKVPSKSKSQFLSEKIAHLATYIQRSYE